ncbi:MAG: sulfatase-like hydrolase/transferase, partial [Myxococcales bacterium]|nr:sulfatase-like hydrolase/transferase [Myxococcales bacterium]
MNEPTQPQAQSTGGTSMKKRILFAAKLLFSVGMLFVILRKVLVRDGAGDLGTHLAGLRWGWVAGAVLMQLTAIAFSTVRWQRLLIGQGIRPTWGFLSGSIMIARFWGAFTPGGFTGFGGWRIYDVAKHTGKTARAAATIGVEMILGQLAFGVVVMGASIYGVRFIGTEGVVLVNAFFLALIAAGIVFLSKPGLVRRVAGFAPAPVATRVRTLVDAVCAYQGKGRLLTEAALLGTGTHAFNNLIYVCAARALGVELGVGEVFFGSSLQIFATLLPLSINGIGLREATAVALYTKLGVPGSVAVLIPIVGFAAEMFVSAFGGLIFVVRRSGYAPTFQIDDPDREDVAHSLIPEVPEERWPSRLRGLVIGSGAGCLGGLLLGLGEALAVIVSGGGRSGYGVLVYGAVSHGIIFGVLGAFGGLALAWSGRIMRREAMPEHLAYARMTAGLVAFVGFALGAFRVRRDVFHEELVWKSPKGLLVLLACAATAAILYLVLSKVLAWIVAKKPARLVLKPWGTPLLVVLASVLMGSVPLVCGPAVAEQGKARVDAPTAASNVLFVVVDTLRADHLPDFGYASGKTPNLSAFANDAIRFDQAFSNASWTRPSFASILTGRYPSNHGVMSKASVLPEEVPTMAESLHDAGYYTFGLVTNYNVAPYFNFQQGFDEYRYLEPEFVLGADDQAAKLLLIQTLRRAIETYRAKSGTVHAGTAYRDATTVNGELRRWFERAPAAPWFAFVGYMDPHDPYFAHPYTGNGYSRAAHQNPQASEADALRKLYDGEVTYWDEEFGALLADLKKRGVYDDMTIVITADHGEEFGEHGGFWHGTTLYDEQV